MAGKGQGAAKTPKDSTLGQSLDAISQTVAHLLAAGNTKSAVETAKRAHKQFDSQESESLLCEVYAARVKSMLAKGMDEEAQTLLEMAQSRHPAGAQIFEELALHVSAKAGRFDALLAPLSDPDLPADARRRIEDTVRYDAADLEALAECGVLAPDHPLRQAARAAWTAFQAVTAGTVDDETIALPEISRRSPLASWKTLIRAIACFYQHKDDQCRQYLDAIEPETPPARLVPVLHAMVNNTAPEGVGPRGNVLMKRVTGDLTEVRNLLEKAERTIKKPHFYADDPVAMKAIREAVNACKSLDEKIAVRIRRQLWGRAFEHGFHPDALQKAIVPPVCFDSAYWAFMTQVYLKDAEGDDDLVYLLAAASLEEFRSHAVHEGVFGAQSPEAAQVYRLILGVLASVDESILPYLREEYTSDCAPQNVIYRNQRADVRAGAANFDVGNPESLYFLYPDQVCERVVEAHPLPAYYREWLEWRRARCSWKACGEVAERWASDFPRDAEPLLYLMEAAEQRKAYTKALSYLEQAEKRDALNPKVRRARTRLLLGNLRRHISQNKPHLAAKDLDALETKSSFEGHERRGVEAALRAAQSTFAGEGEAAERHREAATAVLGDNLAGEMLCWGVAKNLGLPSKQLPPLTKLSKRLSKGRCAAAVARACALARDFDIVLETPVAWHTVLQADLRNHAFDMDVGNLQVLAEALLAQGERKLAFYATQPGIARNEPCLSRFLMLRAQALTDRYPWRPVQCLRAAIELARRDRNMDVLDTAVDMIEQNFRYQLIAGPESRDKMNAVHLQEVIAYERQQKKYSQMGTYNHKLEMSYYPKCQCPECQQARDLQRRSRRTGINPFKYFGRQLDQEPPGMSDLFNGWNPLGDDLPREVEEELERIIKRYAQKDASKTEMEEAVMHFLYKYIMSQCDDSCDEDETQKQQRDLFDDMPF